MSDGALPQEAWRGEITSAVLDLASSSWPSLFGLALFGVATVAALRFFPARLPPVVVRVLPRVIALGAVVLGVTNALAKPSLYDDAYISFRYARNLVEGHGLVWNVGEVVEGYTNFLWTVLIALMMAVTSLDAPELGFFMAVIAFAANLVVVYRLGRALVERETPTALLLAPLAAVLLAFQDTFTTYGTTGLETGFASLLVNLGALALVARDDVKGALGAGAALIAAVLTRPDHALFYAAGALVLVVDAGPAMLAARGLGLAEVRARGLDRMLAYAAPFLVYLAYLAWKLAYYGDVLPNTYYAKAADTSYWIQGEIYMRAFFLQSHFWWVALVFTVAAVVGVRTGPRHRRFFVFAVPSVVLYTIYVWKVGGDFMHGRFYVSLLPLLVTGALAVVQLDGGGRSRRRAVVGTVLAGSLFVTMGALPLYEKREVRWHLLDERLAYPVSGFSPITVDHHTFRTGKLMGALHDEGYDPVLATTSIGIIGYYGRVPIIDRLGLTDKTVAHLPLGARGRPGHEKYATREYLVERRPNFIRGGRFVEREWETKTRIDFGKGTGGHWNIWVYDRALMRHLREHHPEVRFTDFEAELDRYIATLAERSPLERKRDLAFLRRYYFDVNDDPARWRQIVLGGAAVPVAVPSPDAAAPAGAAPGGVE